MSASIVSAALPHPHPAFCVPECNLLHLRCHVTELLPVDCIPPFPTCRRKSHSHLSAGSCSPSAGSWRPPTTDTRTISTGVCRATLCKTLPNLLLPLPPPPHPIRTLRRLSGPPASTFGCPSKAASFPTKQNSEPCNVAREIPSSNYEPRSSDSCTISNRTVTRDAPHRIPVHRGHPQ